MNRSMHNGSSAKSQQALPQASNNRKENANESYKMHNPQTRSVKQLTKFKAKKFLAGSEAQSNDQ